MNCSKALAFLACALLVFSFVGCGTTNHLQSIQLSTSPTSETPMGGLNVPGISSTLQLYTWGNYSSGEQKLLLGQPVKYQIVLDPDYNVDALNRPLPQPFSDSGLPQVLQLSPTGLLTAIDPAVCTYYDVAEIVPPSTTAPAPSWQLSGSYDVTATFAGFTTPPANIGVSSAGGSYYYPPGDTNDENNPNGLCD